MATIERSHVRFLIEDKIEWVKKCTTEYEYVSDYEEAECEEKIKVPTWKLEDKEIKVCEEEVCWEGKEVDCKKYSLL